MGSNLHAARYVRAAYTAWRERLLAQLERRRDADGRVALSFEIVYGHAVRPRARTRVARRSARCRCRICAPIWRASDRPTELQHRWARNAGQRCERDLGGSSDRTRLR